MPFVHENFLHCVVYLYPSVQDANVGARAGGSGFIISVPSRIFPEQVHYLYAVTNRHIIETARSPVIRINTHQGGFDVMDIAPQSWLSHPDGEDLAICSLPTGPSHHYAHFSVKGFLNAATKQAWHIGPGEEVIVVGRFISHDAIQRNHPSVRSGIISMMPGDPILQDNGHPQVSFVVECHSIGGYSGSPVFLRIPHGSQRPGGIWMSDQILLMGVDWGHIFQNEPILMANGYRHPDGVYVRRNTGMMGVVPIWMLGGFLDHEDVRGPREENEKRLEMQRDECTRAADSTGAA